MSPPGWNSHIFSQIIPVRCFSCGKVIGDKWNAYLELLARDMSEGWVFTVPWTLSYLTSDVSISTNRDALDELQLKRYCCRRMVLTHVDLIEKLLHYNRASGLPYDLATLHPLTTCVNSHGTYERQGKLLACVLPICNLHLSSLRHYTKNDSALNSSTAYALLSWRVHGVWNNQGINRRSAAEYEYIVQVSSMSSLKSPNSTVLVYLEPHSKLWKASQEGPFSCDFCSI